MHIVLLNDYSMPTAKGGSAVVTELERRELAKRGHTVTLITTHQDHKQGTHVERRDEFGEAISIYVDYPLKKRHWKSLKMPAVSAQLEAILSELKPDVVHAHTIHMYLTYDALRVAARHAAQVYMTAHDTFMVSFARVKGSRYEQDVHNGRRHVMHWYDHLKAVGRRYNPLRNQAIRKAVADSGTVIISISYTLSSFLQANCFEHVTTVVNAIEPLQPPTDSDVQAWRKEQGISGPTILYGGRISADKGIGALLAAMPVVLQSLPEATLLVVGEQERLDPFLKEVPEAVAAAVHCTGWIDQKQMPLAYGAADVVCTPSLYLDAFNLMNIEAMNAGKPVVGTCFGGTAEIVQHQETGLVCDPHQSTELGINLLTILKDKDIAVRMGANGRKRIEEVYNLSRHVDELEGLFSN